MSAPRLVRECTGEFDLNCVYLDNALSADQGALSGVISVVLQREGMREARSVFRRIGRFWPTFRRSSHCETSGQMFQGIFHRLFGEVLWVKFHSHCLAGKSVKMPRFVVPEDSR